MDDVMSMVLGVVSIVALVVGGGWTIMMVCLAQIRACERHSTALVDGLRKETEARIAALQSEFHARIEALRMETKDDRHNYVEKIDSVLAELREDIQSVDKAVTGLTASVNTAMRLEAVNAN